MIVVRRWVTKTFKNNFWFRSTASLTLLSILSSCNPTEIPASGQRINSGYTDASLANRAFIYRDSPAIIEGPNFGPQVNMKRIIDDANPELITIKSQLKSDCNLSIFSPLSNVTDCLQTFGSKSASQQPLNRNSDGTWIFPVNSSEFYQVNGHYHAQLVMNKFFESLEFAYNHLQLNVSPWVVKSMPKYLNDTKMFWFKGTSNPNYFNNTYLSNYALCNLELNASFSPAGPEVCMGKWSAHSNFFMVQDPSIIYHEMGHAFVAIMMNFRNANIFGTHPLRSNLGGYGFDEAGSIGEGIADYFSFFVNGRSHIGEWGLKFAKSTRPLAEDDEMHIPGIDTTSEGRLSYPQYLLYNPNNPNVPEEDVHYAGQIVGHYLVALTKAFQTECSIPAQNLHSTSTSYVLLLLAETLAEIGDLNAIGMDQSSGAALNPSTFTSRFNNMDENASFLWTQVVNPPNYRRFFQIFSKNINKYITGGLCSSFTRDESEKLLDDYGLLLFKAYNNDGSSTKSKNIQISGAGTATSYMTPLPPTKVFENNRRKSVLVSKELIELATPDEDEDVATYYIIDDQENMSAVLQNLLFKGFPMNPSTGIASVEYNNSNIRISPGEIVALIPNLKNNSNSIMAGVQLLATDWDHVHITDTTGINGNYKPCKVDDVTTTAQGAESGLSCNDTLDTYRRHVKQSNGYFRTDEVVAPVCMVQLEEGEVTKWVSQNEFRKNSQGLSLQDKDCLGFGTAAATTDFTFNPHECLVRILPGANEAYFSKIAPQKSYSQTMRSGNPNHIFGPGNAIVMEVNKWIPPGTKFRCRMRARFTNCSDCYNDPADATADDYIDREYNGAKPFKVINIEFDVND